MEKTTECPRCKLVHGVGELFVDVGGGEGEPVMVETCELEEARAAAHAAPQPSGAVAFHATRNPEEALVRGLDPSRGTMRCKHVCLAKTAEIAAALREGALVLAVDVAGLDLFFELGEARHHGAPIAPERLRVLDPQPAPDEAGWSDPGWRRNHSDCIALLGYPQSRRLLRATEEEYRRRWLLDEWDDDRFRRLAHEIATSDHQRS